MKKTKTKAKLLFDNKPLIIKLENLTDDKLYNVDIFDWDYEKQFKIKYSSTITWVSYDNMLRELASLNECKKNIRKFMLISYCNYKKFVEKQLNFTLCASQLKTNGDRYDHNYIV
ncbi:MAG: hypothetical protein AABY22_27435, partial [Nanoarchaeota archaeon]